MCATCGCSDAPGPGAHPHPHPHANRLAPPPAVARTVQLEHAVLGKNDRIAARNRALLEERNVLALNLVSSPGAGKTTLLERTLRDLAGEIPALVVEGDQETPLDAERIRATGCPVVQINTGRGCHLDAAMIEGALAALDPPRSSLLFIENVGNLVCPALFDLGERAKIVVASTPEGEEKPLKYPHMFRASRLMLLNKVDLSPHLRFAAERCVAHARSVNPALEVLEISATRGDGLERWYAWLRRELAATRTQEVRRPAR
jgi:hydrogenase nickel incorporation protein HypB